MADGSVSKTGVAIQLTGGVAGPDGIEMDSENGLLVCHLGIGIWRFDNNMLPTHLIYSDNPHHHHLANMCFGGPDGKDHHQRNLLRRRTGTTNHYTDDSGQQSRSKVRGPWSGVRGRRPRQ